MPSLWREESNSKFRLEIIILGDLLYDYYHTLSKGIKYFISNIYCLTPTVMTNKLTIIDLLSIT